MLAAFALVLPLESPVALRPNNRINVGTDGIDRETDTIPMIYAFCCDVTSVYTHKQNCSCEHRYSNDARTD